MSEKKEKVMGRPRMTLDKETLKELYDEYQRWDKVAVDLGVSLSTVMRRVKEYNIQRVFVRCD